MRKFDAHIPQHTPTNFGETKPYRLMYTLLTILILVSLLTSCIPFRPEPKNTTLLVSSSQPRYIDFVDPFIGTDGNGKTFPGASVPHGMVQLSPDNGHHGSNWEAGYFYPDNVIAGFSHTHSSGGDNVNNISFMPHTPPYTLEKLDKTHAKPSIISHFSHDNETAKPGYYQVYLQDYQINVELTAGLRSGVQRYRYSFPKGQVKLDLGASHATTQNVVTQLEIVDDKTIRGMRKVQDWGSGKQTWFYSRFSHPFLSINIANDGEVFSGKELLGAQFTGSHIEAVFQFATAADRDLTVATAISYVSADNAEKNLKSDISDDLNITASTFDYIRTKAEQMWEDELRKVDITASPDNVVQFYTALYHSAQAPRIYSDINGDYLGSDGKIYQSKLHSRYQFLSLWDTFRAQHPWKTITDPARTEAMMHSILAYYKQQDILPLRDIETKNSNALAGFRAIPMLTDAWLKNILNYEGAALLDLMTASAQQQHFGLKEYNELGYVPSESVNWSVSRTLEYSLNDFAIAKVAEKQNENEIASTYLQKSKQYQNLFDNQSGLIRAKQKNGSFKQKFDPLSYQTDDYFQANAWQYSFFIPHDIKGMTEMYGSPEAFITKLDEMFSTQSLGNALPAEATKHLGQYTHRNASTHHIPYLYRLAGQPHKGEQKLRQIQKTLYTTQPDGLPGKENGGKMSSWYLFSAIGFYPVNPVGSEYILGSPEVHSAIIHLENGRRFRVLVSNQTPENIYVKEVWLNDKRLKRDSINHNEIMQGGTLRFVMTDKPK